MHFLLRVMHRTPGSIRQATSCQKACIHGLALQSNATRYAKLNHLSSRYHHWKSREPSPSFLDRGDGTRSTKLTVRAELAVERLLEYRSALITHAVTGKMDVCGSVAHAGAGGG